MTKENKIPGVRCNAPRFAILMKGPGTVNESYTHDLPGELGNKAVRRALASGAVEPVNRPGGQAATFEREAFPDVYRAIKSKLFQASRVWLLRNRQS